MSLYALGHIRYVHFVLFSVSWIVFFLTGKIFFEYVLGSYHSSGSQIWAVSCKILFLLTFVIACTLLELLSLEILDLMHAELREWAWTITLGMLCALLNVFIPASVVVSVGLQMGLSIPHISFYTVNVLALFQIMLWLSGELLPLSVLGHHPTLFQYILSMPFNVQQSVAHLTVIGSATAAIISGFATVSFPLQQLMMLRGVDTDLLRNREATLRQFMREICAKKKAVLVSGKRRTSRDRLPARPSARLSFSEVLSTIPAINFGDVAFRNLFPALKRKNSFAAFKDDDGGLFGSTTAAIADQERMAEELFFEVVHLRELVEDSDLSKTAWGRLLHVAGYLCSAVGIFRVYVGSFHIVAHFIGDHKSFYSGVEENEDMVTTAINFILVHLHLRVDEFLWPPALSFLMVGVLSLMQVRVFLATVQDFARFGFLSTNTEVYALILSLFAGVYFVACVVLLRIQLPPRRRLAVTAALGKDIQFDFYLFWFDLFFVLSAIFFGVVLLIHHVRKQRLLDMSVEKFNQEQMLELDIEEGA